MNLDLDPILHQPVRTRIMAYLMTLKSVDFTSLKKNLELTDGHMSTHMKTLLEAEYVKMKKEFVNDKPKTSYEVTETGKAAFQNYLEALKKLVSIE
jgi:DNA-binding MarR family transcriptional regulator